MGLFVSSSNACATFFFFLLFLFTTTSTAQLSPTFYDDICPDAIPVIRTSIESAISRETRMAASLIRLHFHDCFVQGCDASVLLERTSTTERSAPQNTGLTRGFDVIEEAKTQVESVCPGVVSCADILAVAARDASVAVDGPSWTVNLGRRDSTTSGSLSDAQSDLPRFSDGLDALISGFSRKGLNEREMVALSGSHTIGQAACATYRDRINNNASDIDPNFASDLKSGCPAAGNGNSAPLDLVTPNSFDNNYYSNLIARRGLLTSDQALFSGGSSDSIVNEYSSNPAAFSSDFAAAMVKMGDIDPLTGSAGQIRRICSAVN